MRRRSDYAYGGQITDWQPCPTGTCAVWGLHTARTLSLQASKKKVTKGRKVTFTGAVVAGGVSVCTAGQTVDLQKAGTGRHAQSAPGRGHDDAAGRFKREDQDPQHRPLPGRGHRATGLPDRDVPVVKVRGEAPQATQIGVRSPTVAG